jgi:hypothetical protein
MIKRITPVLIANLLQGLLPASTDPTASLRGYGLSWWTVDCGGSTLAPAGPLLPPSPVDRCARSWPSRLATRPTTELA